MESAYCVAKRGGKHSGFLKNVSKWTAKQRGKSVRKLQRRIEIHEGYLDNPVSHVPDWHKLRPGHQESLIRHWNKEITDFAEQQSILRALGMQ